MKRKRDTLTGGTGDVKPQMFTMEGQVAGAVDDYRIDTFNMPIVRPGVGNNTKDAVIMELLKVQYYLGIQDATDTQTFKFAYLTPSPGRSSGDTSTLATFREDVGDARVLAPVFDGMVTNTSGSTRPRFPIEVDLTDGDGNGVLWAGDTMSLVYGDVAGTTAASVTAKLLYRFTKVSLVEYLGIVQSQQP